MEGPNALEEVANLKGGGLEIEWGKFTSLARARVAGLVVAIRSIAVLSQAPVALFVFLAAAARAGIIATNFVFVTHERRVLLGWVLLGLS